MYVHRKALFWGTGTFVSLYFIHLLLLPVLVGTGRPSNSFLYGVHQALGLATCLLAGFVAGRLAGEKGFWYGLAVAALGTALSALAAVLWSWATGARFPFLATLPFWMVVNGFLGAFAGLVATLRPED
ncbi:hypothetical protein [Candidatus Methylocalor cossyra]|uniref:Uncharacterized protein n=1 Tax=Candidatus Methylocalor cossyra TaxID=3108543 RepID=A0ABP1C7J3_9GAMM